MSINKLPVAGTFYAQAETNFTAVQGTVAGTPTPVNGILTVTTAAAHGLVVGGPQGYVTFAGATSTAYNGTIFTVLTVPTTTTFTIGVGSLGQLTGATINTQQVLLPPAGNWFILVGANAIAEYNPDNTGTPQPPQQGTITSATPIVTGAVWRTLNPTSGANADTFPTDGYAVRVRAATATAGNTYLSQVN